MLPWFLHPGAFSSKQHSPPPNPQLGPTYRAPISSKNHSQNSCVLFAQDKEGDLSLAVAEAIREGRWASLLAEPSVFFLARRVITASSPGPNHPERRSIPLRLLPSAAKPPAASASQQNERLPPPPEPPPPFPAFSGVFLFSLAGC